MGWRLVVVIDRSPTFQFAPSLLWVLSGAGRPDAVRVRSPTRRRSRCSP